MCSSDLVMRVLRPHGDVNYLYAKVTIKSVPSNKKVLFLYPHHQQLIISCLYTYNNLYEQRGKTYLLVNSSPRQLKKNFFSFFTLPPSQSASKPCVYRCFSGEGKCEGVRVNRMKSLKQGLSIFI